MLVLLLIMVGVLLLLCVVGDFGLLCELCEVVCKSLFIGC